MREKIIYIFIALILLAATSVSAKEASFYQRLERKGYDIINVENDGLKQFLDNRAYDNPELTGNYGYSIVRKYSKGEPPRPAGITLTWDSIHPVEEISSIMVTLVESDVERGESFFDDDWSKERVKHYYPDINKREYLLCNMCPQKYCYYKVEEVHLSGVKTLLAKGKFYTEGEIRMLRVGGMTNVRDFGGWYTSFGHAVVYGKLFRGGRAEGITMTGKNDFVKNEHITADLDLRGNNLGESPLGPLDQVEYFCTNNQRYKLALTSRTSVLAKDLEFIADVLQNGGSVFLHCNHGANRAGTLSFLIDGLLGFSEDDLSRDYELSSFAYGGISRSRVFGDMLPVIRSYGEPDDELAQCFYNFARSIGASEETLDTIRCEMLGLSPKDPLILEAHR